MIDNHEDARPYQLGLENAVFIQEQLVEGFITRFEAVFDMRNLPAEVGPIRSARPYFIDGVSPIVSAIMHVGGSPEALEQLEESATVTDFNALNGYDRFFTYDDEAPAPHHRFLTSQSGAALFAKVVSPISIPLPLFPVGAVEEGEPATMISINYYSTLHNVEYIYNADTKWYQKESGKTLRPPFPPNLLLLETDVAVVGPLGRLSVRMNGSGSALLFRDGMVKHGNWSKWGDDVFFSFTDETGKPFTFHKGQVWMLVLDSLKRVSWQ